MMPAAHPRDERVLSSLFNNENSPCNARRSNSLFSKRPGSFILLTVIFSLANLWLPYLISFSAGTDTASKLDVDSGINLRSALQIRDVPDELYALKPLNSANPAVVGEEETQEVRSLKIKDTVFQRGDENYIDIELASNGDVNGASFTLEFDVEQLDYVRTDLGPDLIAYSLDIDSDFLNEGLLGVKLALNPGEVFQAGSRKILRIYFRASSLYQAKTTRIEFSDSIFTAGTAGVDGVELPADFLPGDIVFEPQLSTTPSITSLDPSAVIVGGGELDLIINGADFASGAVVTINGEIIDSLFVSPNELRAVIPAVQFIETGIIKVGVRNPQPGGDLTSTFDLLVIEPALSLPGRNPVPALSKISPTLIAAGSGQLNLAVSGFGFVNGVTVLINGSPRVTSLVSGNSLNVQVPASDTAKAGTVRIQAVNPGPGGGTSNTLSLEIRSKNPIPRITSLDPEVVTAGGSSFSLSVRGANFVAGASVRVNGIARSTTFVTGTQVRVTISAQDITAAPGPIISVVNPLPGGGTSNRVRLTVEIPEFPPGPSNPRPSISKISPGVLAIGNVSVSLTINGSNFIPSSEVNVNGNRCSTKYISATELNAEIPATYLKQAATLQIRVVNGEPGGGTSNTLALQVKPANPLPRIDSLSQDNVIAGSPGFTLIVNGASFVSGSFIRFNGANRTTKFISTTQLSASINAADTAKTGTALISVFNPAPGGGSTSALTLTIAAQEFPSVPGNPVPAISKIDPGIIGVGTVPVTINLTGARYIPASEVRVNGNRISSTYLSPTSLSAIIPSSYLSQPGALKVQVFNSEPGGGVSNTITLQVKYSNPLPRLDSITPDSVKTGGDSFTMMVRGVSFVSDSVVLFNGKSRPTQFVSNNLLKATVSFSDIISESIARITVFNPEPGGGTSNSLVLEISDTAPPLPKDNPEPEIDEIEPYLVVEGGPSFILRITGDDFVIGAEVLINGQPRPAKFVSDTELETWILSSDIAVSGELTIQVINPEPGGGASSELILEVRKRNPIPRVLSIVPTIEYVNATTFKLVVQGRNFVQDSVGQINGEDRPTEFIGNSKLRVTFYLSDISENGTIMLGVRNPQPGGGSSNRLVLTLLNPE